MEMNNGVELTKIDRQSVFDTLPDNIKEYSLRIAKNVQIIYKEIVEKQMFEDYIDVDAKHIEHIYEIVKYFDIGYAFKDDKTLFPNKTLPIFHVKKGAAVFFADVKKREDFKALSDKEKLIRRCAKDVAYYHHERWDGKGYPEGLRKEEIPLLARICSICLAFEEMTYDRTTKIKKAKEEAVEFIAKEAGRAFDPSIVLLVLDMVDKLAVHGDAYLLYEEAQKELESEKEEPDINFEDVTLETSAIDLADTEPILEIKEQEKITNPSVKKTRKVSRPIEMLFMPVYDIKTESIVYYQTNLIVNDSKLGTLTPTVYSLVAEKTNKISKIIEIGLRQVILFIKLADILEHKAEYVSVRLYAKIVESQRAIKKVIKQIVESGIEPSRFIFEIPETVLANANEKTAESIKELKSLGCKIAISDFGFEYSSLHKLSDIEFDILKISKEYILNVDSSSRSAGVVRSIIDMVKTLGAEEVCEGVDTEDQKQTLQKIGCRKIQGAIVGEPKNSKDLLGF